MNFTAIDFETATYDRMPCQLGLVVVSNGIISVEESWLIRPPLNKYDAGTIRIHHITPADTAGAPEFYELWNEIKLYLDNTLVVSHNRAFDLDVLNKVVEYYDLYPVAILKFECTKILYQNKSLAAVTAALGIELPNHHDALCDARACAEIYLSYLNGVNPKELDYNKKSDYQRWQELKLSAEVQQAPDLSKIDNKNTPFFAKKIVITGIFTRFEKREDLAVLLKNYGADINVSISKKTDYVIVGQDFGYSKMKKITELQQAGEKVKIIEESQLYNILDSIK